MGLAMKRRWTRSEPPGAFVGLGLMLVGAMWLALVCALLFLLPLSIARARDDGRYAQSPLKPWFDSLRTARGYCCSEADGLPTEYEMHDGSYWVPIDGTLTRVPDDAVITQPNLAGRAFLWLTIDRQIRCFIPSGGV